MHGCITGDSHAMHCRTTAIWGTDIQSWEMSFINPIFTLSSTFVKTVYQFKEDTMTLSLHQEDDCMVTRGSEMTKWKH